MTTTISSDRARSHWPSGACAGRAPRPYPRPARLIRRRGGPTATGSARSRPQSSGIPDLSVRGQRRAPLVQPILQNADRGGLVDHRSLSLGADAGLPQRPLRGTGSESFVGQPHRDRCDARRQLRRRRRRRPPRPTRSGRRASAAIPPPPRPRPVRRPAARAGARACPSLAVARVPSPPAWPGSRPDR